MKANTALAVAYLNSITGITKQFDVSHISHKSDGLIEFKLADAKSNERRSPGTDTDAEAAYLLFDDLLNNLCMRFRDVIAVEAIYQHCFAWRIGRHQHIEIEYRRDDGTYISFCDRN